MKQKVIIVALFFCTFVIIGQRVFGQPGWTRANSPLIAFNFFSVNDPVLLAIPGAWSSGIWRSDDHGINWVHMDSTFNPTTIAITNAVLFAGVDTGIFMSTDQGKTWSPGSINSDIIAIATSNPYIFASAYNGIFKSADKGKSWQLCNDSLFALNANVFVPMDSILYIGTPKGIFRSMDFGVTWNVINSGLEGIDSNVRAIAVNGNNVFASINQHVFYSSNNGSTWTQASSQTVGDCFAMDGSNLFAGWLGEGPIYLSTNKGKDWENVGVGHRLSALVVSGPNLISGSNNIGTWYCPLSNIYNSLGVQTQPNLNISLSPNPTTGIITVHNAPVNMLRVTITNVLGQTVSEVTNSGGVDFTIDLSKFPPGTYFAKFSSADGVVTRKIIKE